MSSSLGGIVEILCKFGLKILQSFCMVAEELLMVKTFFSSISVISGSGYVQLFICLFLSSLRLWRVSNFIFVAAFIQEMLLTVLYNKNALQQTPSNI